MPSRVFLDTAPLIYLFERKDELATHAHDQIVRWLDQDAELVTSTLTLIELLVHPERLGDRTLVRRYRHDLEDMLSMPLVPLSPDIAEQAAALRAKYGLRTPDAVQVATAQLTGCAILFSNDHGLPTIPGLSVVHLR